MEVITSRERGGDEYCGERREDQNNDACGPNDAGAGHDDHRLRGRPASTGGGAPSSVLTVVSAFVALRGGGGESEEHELRHPGPALQPVAARVEHGQDTLATLGVACVPDRAMDRDPRAEQSRPGA